MRLRRNQICPIHRSRFCCGREAVPQERRLHQISVRRIDDPHDPRAYRELRSNGEMRKLMNPKIALQQGKCALCGEKFTDYSDVVPDQQSPRSGRRVAGRSPGQYSGGALVVQRGEGIEPVLRRSEISKSRHEREGTIWHP